MSREDLHFRLRIPEDLKRHIEKAAANNHRSMTAEIVARVEETFIDDVFRLDAELAEKRAQSTERRQIRELQGKYFAALADENEALKRASVINDHIIFQFASAIMKAAEGNRTELEQLVEREKTQPVLKRLVTVSSIVEDD